MFTDKKIVVVGGGTGTYSVLSGLKKISKNITAVVSMADSGGSAKKERDEWGLLPSSDIRKSLLALADVSTENSLLLRQLFQYRYSQGIGVKGMTFGNLFLVALTKLLGSQAKAIEKAGELLQIKGKVLPVTLNNFDLVATYEDGSRVIGEHSIDNPKHNGEIRIVKLLTKPNVSVTIEVKNAILESDVVIIGPGGFYTTILASLIVEGVVDSLIKSKAKKIFILNLMTEYGQTYKYTASDFINGLNQYFPFKYLDYVFINKAPIPNYILKKYIKYHVEPVVNNLSAKYPFKIIADDLLSKRMVRKEKGDYLNRSLIRHSPEKLARLCVKLKSLL